FRSLLMAENSSLLHAIERQDSVETNRILDEFPSEVSHKDEEGRVALHYAADLMRIETVKKILDNDTSLIDAVDVDGMTPLMMGVQAGREDVVNLLLDRGASIFHIDENGHSLVHWAVVSAQLGTLKVLIERGAPLDVKDHNGAQPLHYATAMEGLPDNVETAILLTLIRKAPVNARDLDERTPLMWAASNGNVDALLSLKQGGGEMNGVDRDGMTLLHMAASAGSAEMIERVLELVPTSMVNQKERSGCTPLFYSVAHGYYEPSRLLLAKNANPNHQDNNLRTPSHIAAAKGQLRILKLLKQFGGSFEMQNYRGDIPLHEAVQTGSKDVVEWLLSLHPSTVNASSHTGRTSLHIAAAKGHIAIVILLCGQSAHVNPLMLLRKELATPLDLAIQQNHQIVVDYLRMRQDAVTAQQLPDDVRRESRATIEESISQARTRRGKHRAIDSDDVIEGRKSRKVRADGGTNGKGEELTDSSSDGRRRITHATSTTDLKSGEEGEEDRGSRLVEERIEKIIREEMRAAREEKGEKSTSDRERNGSKRRRRQKRETKENEEKSSSEEDKPTRNSTQSADGSEKNRKNRGERRTSIEGGDTGVQSDESEEDTNENENGAESQEKVKRSSTSKSKKNSTKQSTGKQNNRKSPMEEETGYDIFEDEWEELSDAHPTGKEAQRRYVHEKSIFQELTHLKRMQIQYGKVQERVLVHSLVGNFCKMHGLNPADYKFSSFYSWEKYLYEQLKSIYMEERERLQTSAHGGNRPSHAQRLNKFETKLRQARAVPLNDRIRELTRIYGSASMTAGKKVQQRNLFSGQKRCDCLGKHLLVKST
ncbi:hypothetical protein PMAYCL1PPCAC_29496, partial [Pristionchus mayeri]